jgi:hypothetical protein
VDWFFQIGIRISDGREFHHRGAKNAEKTRERRIPFPMRINLRDSNPVRGDMFIEMAQPNISLAP